ncbi:hypothetical protein ALC56_08552 [Trachymyrmex septentrionalis]|uniref:Uncharacterized protein n=1 Tax=Trachymyrmex septentrionalis TaxID=34720 RepID=A0A195F8Q4_9HYME|nr:hypothetical protein ALC56_08552 [Trachymyrmex septentrionalis]
MFSPSPLKIGGERRIQNGSAQSKVAQSARPPLGCNRYISRFHLWLPCHADRRFADRQSLPDYYACPPQMPVMLTTSKQIMAYPGLRLPKGYLVATTRVYTPEPSSEYYTLPVTSLCYGLCHTNSSFNLSGERRRTSYPMERSLDERHPQDWLLFDHHKRERLPLYPSTYLYYTFQAVSLVSAKLSRLYCPARLTVNFACWVAIIEIQEEAEDMKYETLRADLLETACGVCTKFRTDLIKISCTT